MSLEGKPRLVPVNLGEGGVRREIATKPQQPLASQRESPEPLVNEYTTACGLRTTSREASAECIVYVGTACHSALSDEIDGPVASLGGKLHLVGLRRAALVGDDAVLI